VTTSRLRAVLAILLLAAATAAAASDMRAEMAVRDSLSRVHPRMRASWLRERGLDDSPYTTFRKPDSGSGLHEIGRWPWGPSWELCGRDSLLFLGSGSGVRILSISDSIHPRQLGQIVARSLVTQLVIRDTLLFVACGNWGAQIYSVSDPANPQELGSMNAVTLDLCVRDTLCFTVGGDSLRIYNVADPHLPVQLSAARDSSELVVVSGTYVHAAYDGMNVYDVSNPLSPIRVNTRGGQYLTLFLRDTLLFCSSIQPSYFAILNISDPLNIQQIGYISGHGGIGLYADDQYAYLSCTYDYSGLFVISISNPANPQIRGSYDPEGNDCYDSYVPIPQSYGYVTDDFGGLIVLDLHDVYSPSEAWSGYKADLALDISIDHSLAVIADQQSGTQLVDISDPTVPSTLVLFDTVGARFTYTAAAADSFIFVGMSGIPGRRYLRVLDVLDPSNPILVAQESCRNPPQDMVLRDSFLYCAEVNQFQILNVARPREPVLVGSCAGDGVAVVVQDSFAYTSAGSIRITNVARPDSPFVVTTIGRGSYNICIEDTMLFCAPGPIIWYDLHNPVAPAIIDSIDLGHTVYGLVVVDDIVYASTMNAVHAIDLSDPHRPRVFAQAALPCTANRIRYVAPRLYLACWDAGVCILDTTGLGIDDDRPAVERRAAVAMRGSVMRDELVIELPAAGGSEVMLSACDISGRCVDARVLRGQGQEVRYSFAQLPAGVYVLRVRCSGQTTSFKVVKL
jgi:hypothetical protein